MNFNTEFFSSNQTIHSNGWNFLDQDPAQHKTPILFFFIGIGWALVLVKLVQILIPPLHDHIHMGAEAVFPALNQWIFRFSIRILVLAIFLIPILLFLAKKVAPFYF